MKIRRKGFPPREATFDTKAEAQEWATEIERDINRGRHRLAPSAYPNLGELIDRYAGEVTPRKKGAAQEQYRIAYWRAHPWATERANEIRQRDVREWRDERLEEVSPATVRVDLALLRHIYATARREWDYEELTNPCDAIKTPQGRQRDRRLRHCEYLALCRGARATGYPEFIQIMRLAIETTMREGELARIHGDHVNLARRTVYLPETKNDEPRTVPLTRAAIRTLRRLDPKRGAYLIQPDNPDRERVADWIGKRFIGARDWAGIPSEAV